MTESEWLSCTEPNKMLEFLGGRASDRKLRLFAVSCIRRVFHLLDDKPASRKTIEFAERFADGQATTDALHGNAWGKSGEAWAIVHWQAIEAAQDASTFAAGTIADAVARSDKGTHDAWATAFDVAYNQQNYHLSEARAIADAAAPAKWVALRESTRTDEEKSQCHLVRDIFGNPFRPVTVDPAWLTVKQMAEAIYEERRFGDMPSLADALEEAGCSSADILAHYRQPGEHVRGCWVLDLLLGKD